VITFLSWLWLRAELLPVWRAITRRRHKGELRALQTARSFAPLAIFPIFLTVGGWFFLLVGFPSLILFLLTNAAASISPALGLAAFLISSIFGLVSTCLVAPWLFRWYFIASGLMIGRTTMADRKEADLLASLSKDKDAGRST
jgi:hypothetical protein